MKHTDRNRKNIGAFLHRALPVLLSALLLCSLTGCSVRELHIGQVEVNTGVTTAWITPAKGVDKFAIAAGDFSVRDDGTVTYTFTLRASARWSDGQKVTADDFVYAWQRLADPATASPNHALMSVVAGYDEVCESGDKTKLQVSAKDDTTFVVTLSAPCALRTAR